MRPPAVHGAGGHGQLPEEDPLYGDQLVGEVLDVLDPPPDHHDLQALLEVQMYMGGGGYVGVVEVLDLHEPLLHPSLVMLVYQGDGAHHVGIGIGPSVFHQRTAYEVPNRFRPGVVAPSIDQNIELLKQLGLEGYTDAGDLVHRKERTQSILKILVRLRFISSAALTLTNVMNYGEAILGALDGAVAKTMSDKPVAIMFSGGLDSGVLAALAKRYGSPTLYTVGIDRSHDLRAGEEGASALDLPWTPYVLTEDEVLAACREALSIVPMDHPVVLSFELPLQIIASRCRERDLMSGQGADEIYGGYRRYLDMPSEELGMSLRADLEHVLRDGAPMDHRIAGHYGKEIHHPFLDPGVRNVSGAIPAGEMIRDGVRKAPLRDAAMLLGIEGIASREKKAAQYGSGFMKAMKAEARRRRVSLKDLMAELGGAEQHS